MFLFRDLNVEFDFLHYRGCELIVLLNNKKHNKPPNLAIYRLKNFKNSDGKPVLQYRKASIRLFFKFFTSARLEEFIYYAISLLTSPYQSWKLKK